MLPDRETVARNLRTARENRGLSQHTVARKLGVSRTLVAMVELGNRPVTDEELLQFAGLYGSTLLDLTGMQVSEDDDPVTAALVTAAPELATEAVQRSVHGVLGALLSVMNLERVLERPARTPPPRTAVPPPRTLADALRQGEQLGERERERLQLRSQPIEDVVALVAAEGVPVFAIELPDHISVLFIQHASIGAAVVVNEGLDHARRRWAIAHGYAHAVVESSTVARVSSRANAKELVERRADAFVGAFLAPAAAIVETVRRLGKGQPSRQVQWMFDATAERCVRAEERSAPGSQVMTYLDGARVAQRFGIGYRATVARMLGLGLISEADSARLLRPKFVTLAGEWLELFGPKTEGLPSSLAVSALPGVSVRPAVSVLSDLKAECAYMVAEAYRRGLATTNDVRFEAQGLQLPDLSEARLLAFAEAAR